MMIVSIDMGKKLIEDSERSINDILMQLVCCSEPMFRDALLDMLEEIADLRFGVSPPYPRSYGFYCGPLFWEPFGCSGTVYHSNVSYRMVRLKRSIAGDLWVDRDPNKMAHALHDFHVEFARRCEDGKLDRPAIDVLVYTFETTIKGEL